jgi:histidyl-tRNA synthetase
VLRQVDKLDKIGPDRVVDLLVGDVGSATPRPGPASAGRDLRRDGSFGDAVRRLGVDHPNWTRESRCSPIW